MSIENIIDSILAEAEENAREVRENAEGEAKKLMAQAEKTAKELSESALKRGAEAAALVKDRKLSIAELDARKLRLSARQEALTKCFDAALDKLANMGETAYIDFLGNRIREAARDGGVVLMNEKDRDTVGSRAVALANSLPGGEAVSLGEETISARGGFVLRKDAVEINVALEAVIDSLKEDAIPAVAAVLFEEGRS